ncbi:hypothetical protein [Nocardioides sp. GXZ039]|uniref:hypothetical protein n=1 Tax=Nocardioides sp. GXZ039 TaxID=3136018 RepID=UPI0030F40F30
MNDIHDLLTRSAHEAPVPTPDLLEHALREGGDRRRRARRTARLGLAGAGAALALATAVAVTTPWPWDGAPDRTATDSQSAGAGLPQAPVASGEPGSDALEAAGKALIESPEAKGWRLVAISYDPEWKGIEIILDRAEPDPAVEKAIEEAAGVPVRFHYESRR